VRTGAVAVGLDAALLLFGRRERVESALPFGARLLQQTTAREQPVLAARSAAAFDRPVARNDFSRLGDSSRAGVPPGKLERRAEILHEDRSREPPREQVRDPVRRRDALGEPSQDPGSDRSAPRSASRPADGAAASSGARKRRGPLARCRSPLRESALSPVGTTDGREEHGPR
jgi:hypothetical protein